MAKSVFISYSHEDEAHKDRLLTHLRLLERQGLIAPWDDRQISPAEEWDAAIEARLNRAGLILLLVTANFMKSDYCWKEMTRAMKRHDAGRAKVLPIFVDHCDWKDAPFGKLQGVPKDAKPITAYKNPNEAWKEVAQAIRKAVSPKPARRAGGLGELHGVPSLPDKFVPRPEYSKPLKEKLLAGKGKAVAVTARGKHKTAVQGMGGIGKTVLAVAVVREEDVRRAFPDGVFWLTFGQQPNLIARQIQLANWLGDERAAFQDTQQGKARLEELLRDSACLVVLDDIWEAHHVSPFDAVGGGSRLLVTTRFRNVVAAIGADEQQLDVLDDDQALALLAQWAGTSVASLPPEAPAVVKECGGLPLALAMIGAMIQRRPERWEDALERLRSADIDKIKQDFPDYPYPDLLRAIEVSIDGLDDIKDRYLDFAIFPEDTPIPEVVLETLWAADGLDKYAVHDVLDVLEDRSMLRRDEAGRITLHDLQFDYVRKQVGAGLQARHNKWLNAYRSKCPDGWHTGPNDGHFYQHLAHHLLPAGRRREFGKLLFDYRWLRSKLKATDSNALITDYDLIDDDSQARLVRGAIRLSSHILAGDASHLPSQLCGRLASQKGGRIRSLLTGLARDEEGAWLRPLAANLTPPGGPLLRTLRGHKDGVTAVTLTGDGRYAVTGSEDKTLKVWDLPSGKPVHTLRGHENWVSAVAVTPDGRCAVSGSLDRTLKVWDLVSGRPIHTLRGHKSAVDAVAVTSDGRYAVSGSLDDTLMVWDLVLGKAIHTLCGHKDWVTAVAMTSDGRYAVSGSQDKTLKVWDLGSGKIVHTLHGHKEGVYALALTGDGRHVVSASSDETLKVWDLALGKAVRTLCGHKEAVCAVAATCDGRWVVSGSFDRTLKVWDLASGKAVHTLCGHEYVVKAVAVTPDGRYAVSGSRDQTLKVWDLALGKASHSRPKHKDAVHAVGVTYDGCYAISASDDHTLRVWSLASGKAVHTLRGHKEAVYAVAAMSDGCHVVSGSFDETLKVWDLASGKVVRTLRGHAGGVLTVAVTRDGRCAVSGSHDQTLKVWDLSSGKTLHTLQGHEDWVHAVAVTTDGRYAVSGSSDRTLKVWDLVSGKAVHTLRGHRSEVYAVAVTCDGRYAVSGSSDRTLRVWDLASGEGVHTLRAHRAEVWDVAVTCDGRHAVSASSDRTVKVWNLSTGQLVGSFCGESGVECCAVGPDGRTIVAGEFSGQVHFLRLENVK